MKYKKAQEAGLPVILSILIIGILLIILIAGSPAIIAVVSSFVSTSNNSLINLITQVYLPFAVAMVLLLMFSLLRK